MVHLVQPRPLQSLPSWRTIALGLAVAALSFPLWLR
jgi:hypothetical protein